jgi:CSLREA domain-containing protein
LKSHPIIGLGLAVVATMLTAVLPGTALGATVTVTTTVDAVGMDTRCSLREAITAANTDAAPFGGPGECAAGAGADKVVLPPGRFELAMTGPPEDANVTGDLDVAGGELLLSGAGAAASIVDANQIDRVLEVLPAITATIEGVTLTGGRAPDGANGSFQTGSGAAFGSPGATGANGGGILNAGSLAILDSTISDSRAGNGGNGGGGQGAPGDLGPTGANGFNGTGGNGGVGGSGGGIYNTGSLAMTRVAVLGNTAGQGGVGGAGTGGQGGLGTTDSSGGGGAGFGGAQGDGGFGGGVASDSGASLTIDRSRVSGNTAGAAGSGGSGTGGEGGPNSEARNGGYGGPGVGGNSGEGGLGGGVGSVNSLVLTRSLIEGNAAGAGAGGGTGTGGKGGGQTGTAPAGAGNNAQGGRGGAGGSGGGVWAGPASMVNTTITGNQAGNGGQGGVANGGRGGNGNTIPGSGGNATGGLGGNGGSGGGVRTFGGNTTIRHATITGNTLGALGFGGSAAGGQGGNPGGPGGSAGTQGPGSPGTGGAIAAGNTGGSATTLANSIAAGNAVPSCTGPTSDGGLNITFPTTTCPGTLTDPELEALADNGGPTRTQAVGPGSPAFDAVPATGAGCPATDQRGVTRPHGQGCEIGAFEHAGPDATTGDATAISGTGATLGGEVNPNGRATSHHFEFGTTTAYGSTTPSQDAGAGVGAVAVNAAVGGLTSETTYHYRLVAANANGAAVGADRTFTTLDDTRPRFLAASVKPKVFAVLRRGASSARAKKGTIFRYRLSEAARVTFRIDRVTRGRRVRGRCRKQTPANRGKRACKRYVRAGRLADTGEAGRNSKKFSGRIGKRALSPARYRATLVATDAGGNASAPKRLTFRIVRR